MFTKGDRVRLIKDHKELRFVEAFKAGKICYLNHLYRIQDGIEIWSVMIEVKICGISRQVNISVPHTSMEKC